MEINTLKWRCDLRKVSPNFIRFRRKMHISKKRLPRKALLETPFQSIRLAFPHMQLWHVLAEEPMEKSHPWSKPIKQLTTSTIKQKKHSISDYYCTEIETKTSNQWFQSAHRTEGPLCTNDMHILEPTPKVMMPKHRVFHNPGEFPFFTTRHAAYDFIAL